MSEGPPLPESSPAFEEPGISADADPSPYKPDLDIVLPRLPLLLARGAVYILILSLIAAATWAFLARVDVVVECRGGVIPEGEPIRIESPLAGILVEIPVEVGMRVAEGDLLFRVDPLQTSAQVEKTKQEYAGLEAQERRIRTALAAVREALDKSPTPERIAAIPVTEIAQAVAEMARAEAALAEARAYAGESGEAWTAATEEGRQGRVAKEAALAAARSSFAQAMDEIEKANAAASGAWNAYREATENLRGARASREGGETSVVLLRQEEETYRRLSEAGAISPIEYLSRKRELERESYEAERLRAYEAQAAEEVERKGTEVVQAGVAVRQSEAAAARVRDEIRGLEADIAHFSAEGNRRVESARADYRTARAVAEQALARLAAEQEELVPRIGAVAVALGEAREISERTEVRAPAAGVVAFMEAHNPWEYVQPSRPVLFLIPDTAPMIAEMRVTNRDVAKIRPGDACRFKFDAFPFQDYGVLTGKVASIGPDVVPQSSEYRVLARFARDTFAGPEGTRLIRPGMQFTGEVKVRSRRVAEYLFEPFFKLTRRGMTVTE